MKPLKLVNPHVEIGGPYDLLVVTINGIEHRIMVEQKPTVSRHGIVPLEGSE